MRLNKNFKKALSAVLASAMVFSFAPVVNADEAEPADVAAGEAEPVKPAASRITVCGNEVDYQDMSNGAVTYTVNTTSALADQWNGNFGYIKCSENFDISGVSVKVNDTYTFSFDGGKAYVSEEYKDDPEKENDNYDIFGSNSYNFDLPNMWNFKDGDVMATADESETVQVKYDGTNFQAKLYVDEEEVAIEKAELTFTLAEPVNFTPFQMYIGGDFNSGWNQEFTGDAKLGSKDAGDADDGYYLDITEPGDYTFKFIASENVTDWSVAYIDIPTFHSAQEFFDSAKITWNDVTVKNADETEELAKYPFVKDQSIMFCYWDGEPAKGVRYNLTNAYNHDCAYLTDAEEEAEWGEVTAPEDKDKDGSDADFVELVPTRASDYLPSEVTYSADDVVEIHFTVEAGDGVIPSAGITAATEDMTTTPAFEATDYPESGDEPGGDEPGVTPSTAPTAPATTPAVTNTPAPKKVTTTAAVTTPSAASLKVAKKVVVAAGKTKDVKVTVDPSTFSAITATSANEKLVTVATAAGVVKVTATAAAKKNKGKVVNVTVKAGGKEQIVKVAIQNKAKKMKAAKKKVTVKKNKKAKVTFKVTKAENKSAAVTDLFTKSAKKAAKAAKIAKIAKVKKVTVKKGKVIVTIKATKKKGIKKLTLKVGKAKASCKVTVK